MKRILLRTFMVVLMCAAWSTHCLAWSANEPGTCKTEYGDGVNYTIKFHFKIIDVVNNVPTAAITSMTFERLTVNGWNNYESTGITLTYPNEIEDPRDPSKIIKIVEVDHNEGFDGTWQDETSNPHGKYWGLVKKIIVSQGISRISNLPHFYTNGTIDLELPASLTAIVAPDKCIFEYLNWNGHLGTITIASENPNYKYDNDKYTFFECENSVPKKLTYIRTEKLGDDYTLDLPEGLEAMGDMPSTTKIKKIIMPSTLPSVVFAQNFKELREFGVTAENENVANGYYVEDGVLCRKGTKDGAAYNELISYPCGKTIKRNNSNDPSYTIPTSVSVIRSNAFNHVLVEGTPIIKLPATLMEIENRGFNELSYIILDFNWRSSGLKIADGAFMGSNICELWNVNPYPQTTTDYTYDWTNKLFFVRETVEVDGVQTTQQVLKFFMKGCETVVNCTIPAGVERIASYAFYKCALPLSGDGSGTIFIGPDVKEVGRNAFEECNIGHIDYSYVEEEVGGETVRRYCTWSEIEDDTFLNCNYLVDFKLPPALTGLGASALAGLPFKKITIPETLYCSRRVVDYVNVYDSNIEPGAFQNCTNLEVVTFTGNRITCLRENLFNGCTALKQVNWGDNNVEIIESSAFEGCSELGNEFVFPSSLKRIERAAFKDTGITSLELKNGNTILPEGLEYIGNVAFENCNLGANGLVVPSSVTQIDKQAFLNTGLQKATFPSPSNIKYLGNQCFGTAIQKVNYAATNNNFIQLAGTFKDCTELGCTEQGAFTMPDKVYWISEFCFSGTTSLTQVTFTENSSLYYLTNAFTGSSLTSIDLSPCTSGINDAYKLQIRNESFANCANLTSVKLPYNLAVVENGTVFNNCPNLERIDVAGTTSQQTNYTSVDGYLLNKTKETLVRFPEGKARDKFTLLPPSIRTIGHSSFYSCKQKLTNVVIPNKVTTIEQDAFGDTPNLTTVTFLCDNAVDPHNISMPYNAWAFNEGAIGKITLYVRKNLLSTYNGYAAESYTINRDVFDYMNASGKPVTKKEDAPCIYHYFKAIKPSFEVKDKHDDAASVDAAVYKNEYINTSETAVDLISVKTNDYSYIVPSTVPNPDSETNGTYPNLAVAMIGDYAFQDQYKTTPVSPGAPRRKETPAEGVPQVKEVVVLGNVGYIGAAAFATDVPETEGEYNTSTIERIFFVNNVTEQSSSEELLSTTRFKLQAGDLMKPGGSEETVNGVRDYYEFTQGQRIFVKKSQVEAYQEAWSDTYGDDIAIDYKIRPKLADGETLYKSSADYGANKYDYINIASGKKYGTFSREFDVYLGQYAEDKAAANESIGSFDIKAFTTGTVADGPGARHDNPEDNNDYTVPYHLRMYHIGYGGADETGKPEYKKGTYIPNATGTLLAVMNDWNGTPDDYYYCIGEQDSGNARNSDNEDVTGNGTLHRSIETATTTLEANNADGSTYHLKQWVMQGGIFKPVKEEEIYLPAHKAWLYYEMDYTKGASASAMTFGFSLNSLSEDTGVESIVQDNATAASGIYTLAGVKVLKPEGKGIYIMNGKKMVIR